MNECEVSSDHGMPWKIIPDHHKYYKIEDCRGRVIADGLAQWEATLIVNAVTEYLKPKANV